MDRKGDGFILDTFHQINKNAPINQLIWISSLQDRIVEQASIYIQNDSDMEAFLEMLANVDWQSLVFEAVEEKHRERIIYMSRPTVCNRCEKIFPANELRFDIPRNPGRFCRVCVIKILNQYIRTCQLCECKYSLLHLYQTYLYERLCPQCLVQQSIKELERLDANLNRTRALGLRSDLTLKAWFETLHHFNFLCAYCQTNTHEEMDHYIPISLGGGTTKNNCLPSCQHCNRKKSNIHSSDLLSLFPADVLMTIESFLHLFS